MSSFLRLQKWLDRLILDFNFFDFLEHVDVDTLVILLGPCTRLHLIFGFSNVAILFSLLAGLRQYGGVILIIDRCFLLNVSCRPDRGDCLDAVQRRLISQVNWAGCFWFSFLVFHFLNLNERRAALLHRSYWFFLYHLIVLSMSPSMRKLRTYDFYRRIQILLSSCSVVIFHPVVISGQQVFRIVGVFHVNVFGRVFFNKIEFYLALISFFVDVVRHFFELVCHHLFVKPVVGIFLWQELFVDDFESIAHSVVFPFECTAACQDRVIDTFN